MKFKKKQNIKECPYCATSLDVVLVKEIHTDSKNMKYTDYYVFCSCGLRGPTFTKNQYGGSCKKTKNAAIAAWNELCK